LSVYAQTCDRTVTRKVTALELEALETTGPPPAPVMDGAAVIDAYHDLWRVGQSFRMTKSDLRARPVFYHHRDAIVACFTVVLAALAVTRHLQNTPDVTTRKIMRTLRPLRTVTIAIGAHTLTA